MPESANSATSLVSTSATAADFELGREALLDITDADSIGEPAGCDIDADGVVTVYFATNLAGYPGWRWTVSISRVEGSEPTVLETELTSGEGSLIAPDWVPWSVRLAEYQESQAALANEHDDDDDDDDDDEDDEDDEDDDDDEIDDDDDEDDDVDDDSSDLDGVDIDSLDDFSAESAAPAVSGDEPEDSESETAKAGPEQPAVRGRRQRGKKLQSDEGE